MFLTCYSKVYHQTNGTQNCSICGATPKTGQKFHRHCPSLKIVSKYIKDTIGNDTAISPDDCICARVLQHTQKRC